MRKNINLIGFPSQGELIQFVFKAAGVLPRKYSLSSEIDETTKKNIQKSLARLANEEGNLNDNFRELIGLLIFLLSNHISNTKILVVINEVLLDALEVYREVIREDATFLNKKETMKWVISNYLISRILFSVNKHALTFNVASENLSFPDIDLFLPTINEGLIEYPLAKAMRWAYSLCDISHDSFHYPDKGFSSNHERQSQNLESAINWLNGKHTPSLNTLISNFNFSFDVLEKCVDKDFRKVISEDKRQSIHIALMVARTSTFVFEEIFKCFGSDYFKEVCSQSFNYSNYLIEKIKPFKSHVKNLIDSSQLCPNDLEVLWQSLTPQYFACICEQQIYVAKLIDNNNSSCNAEIALDSEYVNDLVKHYGRLAVLPLIDRLNYQVKKIVPPIQLPVLLLKGFEFKNDPHLTEESIEKYREELEASGAHVYLPWILDWIYGAFYYRKEQYEIAYQYFKNAFESARYCAGKSQYKLVNQFVEIAAKNEKWSEFKKGIEWAKYLDIEIRWLRKQDANKENLESLFKWMKKSTYGAL